METRLRPMVVLWPLLLVGCDQGTSKVQIEGNVVFKGIPIEAGMITFFDAADNKLTAANRAATTISDGRYSLEMAPGEKVVAIEAYQTELDATAPKDSYPGMSPAQKRVQILPARFNVKTELRYTAADPSTAADFKL